MRCTVVHESRELLVELEIVPGKTNRARLGGSPLRRARDVLGALRLVLFAPEDLELVRGEPAERRRYLDELLVARQPRYAGGVRGLRAGPQTAQRVAAYRLSGPQGRRRRQSRRICPHWRSGTRTWPEHGADLLAGAAGADRRARARTWPKAYDAVAAGRARP